VEYDPLRKGSGSLNAKGAIDLGRTVKTGTSTGNYWLSTTPFPWTTIGSDSLEWNQAIVWGNAIVWGSTVGVNQPAWAQAIVWGSNVSWGSAIVWGSNLVWTNPSSWATAIVWGSNTIGYDYGTAIVWGSSTGLTAQTAEWQSLSGNTAATGQQ
jgi:hypothetical protein